MDEKNRSGYDRYLEFMFRQSGKFFNNLFEAITYADTENTEKLKKGFPEEVDAYRTWTRLGQAAFLAKCSPDHPILKEIAEGKKGL